MSNSEWLWHPKNTNKTYLRKTPLPQKSHISLSFYFQFRGGVIAWKEHILNWAGVEGRLTELGAVEPPKRWKQPPSHKKTIVNSPKNVIEIKRKQPQSTDVFQISHLMILSLLLCFFTNWVFNHLMRGKCFNKLSVWFTFRISIAIMIATFCISV